MRKLSVLGVGIVLMAMAAWVWTGCESAGGTEGITLSPDSKIIGSGSSNTTSSVVFTAQVSGNLALPLEWRVANSGLGNIISASGSNATYQANSGKTGDNVITVKDQYGNEGSAVVTQQ
ncbi:MAG: hypothetical protein WCI03_01520 [bacterium]